MSLFRTQHSPTPDMGIGYFWVKNLIVDVCNHKTTYNTKSGTPINFIQEYVSITLHIQYPHFYIYSCHLFIFNSIYVNWMY